MKNLLLPAVVLLFLGVLVSACKKPQKYSEIPAITFESMVVKDSIDQELDNRFLAGVLTFSFVDGDGDLGLNQEDTNPPYDQAGNYYYNLIIEAYKKENGDFHKINLSAPLSYRFKDVSAHGQNKTLKGRIITGFNIINLDSQVNDSIFALGDTLKYRFYIYDKALHQSNTAESSEVLLSQ
jgi:hypothetical protein